MNDNEMFGFPFILNAFVQITPEQMERISNNDSSVKAEIEETAFRGVKTALQMNLNHNDGDLRRTFNEAFKKHLEMFLDDLNEMEAS